MSSLCFSCWAERSAGFRGVVMLPAIGLYRPTFANFDSPRAAAAALRSLSGLFGWVTYHGRRLHLAFHDDADDLVRLDALAAVDAESSSTAGSPHTIVESSQLSGRVSWPRVSIGGGATSAADALECQLFVENVELTADADSIVGLFGGY